MYFNKFMFDCMNKATASLRDIFRAVPADDTFQRHMQNSSNTIKQGECFPKDEICPAYSTYASPQNVLQETNANECPCNGAGKGGRMQMRGCSDSMSFTAGSVFGGRG